jgi:hypothetical protein
MAGIERGPQTLGPGRQGLPGEEVEGTEGTPFEESEDAERLAKLPEHERDAIDRPAEGGLVGGGAAGMGDYSHRMNVPISVEESDTKDEDATR